MRKHSRTLIFSLLYAALAFAAIYVMSSGGLGLSSDSENYLITADRFAQGRWGDAINPIWPPLYPLTVAAVGFAGSAEPIAAARIVSILSYLILVVAVFLVGLRLQGKSVAHLSAVSVLCLASLIYVHCFCWSETLYTMFSVLFFLWLTSFLKSAPEGRSGHLIWAAIFAGLGSVTRFVGISLVATGILSILLLGEYRPWSRKLKRTLVFALVAGVPLLLHYSACFLRYGLAGKTQFPSKFTFWHQSLLWFSTIYHDFLSFDLGFWKYVFFFGFGSLWLWLQIVFLAGAAALLVAAFGSRPPATLSGSNLTPRLAMLLYLVLYSGIILYVGSTVAIDPVGSRFTVPLYPIILLLVISGFSSGYRRLAHRGKRNLALALVIACAGSFWGIQTISDLSIHRGIGSGSFPAMEHPGNLNRDSLRFLKEQADSNDVIITNIPQKLAFIWPRQTPYPDIPRQDWDSTERDLTYEASRRSIYVLICTEDFSPLGIITQDVEETDRKSDLFSWRKDFAGDAVFKTKPVVFRRPGESDPGK